MTYGISLASYYTDEELKEIDSLELEQDSIFPLAKDDSKLAEEQIRRWQRLEERISELRGLAEKRYIEDKGNDGLLEDLEHIVGAMPKARFLEQLAERIERVNDLKASGAPEESINSLKEYAEENYTNCYNFVVFQLRLQLNALAHSKEYTDKALSIIEKKVASWYERPQPDYFPMVHGKPTDALAFMNSKYAVEDKATNTSTIDRFEVELRLYDLSANWGIGADKLWSTALGTFTAQNDFRDLNKSGKAPRREVVIPLREYATLLGYDLLERSTSTPEEAEAEKKRIKNQTDNARKAIKKDLNTIFESELSWEEKIKGKARDFDRLRLVTRASIRNGNILISIDTDIANYLVERNLITQYPAKLLRISGTKPTAYYIGRKLAEYYHIDKNQLRGTNDRISLPALLAVSGLPTYEEVQEKDRGHWMERIKEPLEKALDELTAEGVLLDWKYTHAKAIELTDEEAKNITSYHDFSKLYLHFVLADPIEQPERIEAKEQARAEAREKRRKKKN